MSSLKVFGNTVEGRMDHVWFLLFRVAGYGFALLDSHSLKSDGVLFGRQA